MVKINYNKSVYRNLLTIDFKNKIVHGKEAPKYAERLWIKPRDIKLYFNAKECFINHAIMYNTLSGVVVEEEFPTISNQEYFVPILSQNNIKETYDHFMYNKTWKETGAYERVLNRINNKNGYADGCRNIDDIIARYNNFDKLFYEVKQQQKLLTRHEINPSNFREKGTFTIHINQNGELFLGKGGFHRFAIAYILDIEKVPAQIGCVNKNAIPLLNKYRSLH